MGRERPARGRIAALALAAALAGAGASAGCASAFPDLLETPLRGIKRPAQVPLLFDRPADLLPPEGLRVSSIEDRQVALTWDPVLVGDVAGYAITRAQTSRGPFSPVGRTDSRFGTVFIDSGNGPDRLGDGATYFYRVHPFDRDGSVSRSHAYTSATTEPPPEVPAGLQAYSNRPRKVVLTWEPAQRASVTGYSVSRSPTEAGPWERVGGTDHRLQTVFEDPVPGDLRVMYYRITAHNRFGGQSELTEAVRAVTKAEPLPPVGLSARPERLGRIALQWHPNVERDLREYEVWRETRGASGDEVWSEPAMIGRVPASLTGLTDADVGCGAGYRYWLLARDLDGLESARSAPLEVTGVALGLRLDRSPAGFSIVWDGSQARTWSEARIVEKRAFLPDRVLGEVSSASGFVLPPLSPGRHTVSVLLSRPGEDAGAPINAPACSLEFTLAGDEEPQSS